MRESDLHANRMAVKEGSPTPNPGNPQATGCHDHEQITYRIPLWILRTKHRSQIIPRNRKNGTNYGQWDIDIPSLADCDDRFSNVTVTRIPLTSENPNSVKTGKTDCKHSVIIGDSIALLNACCYDD
jgi:hypothetical protein